jgi:hypothetical protein
MNRRTLVSRLAAMGVGGTLLSTFSISRLLAQTDSEAAELRRGVSFVGDQMTEESGAVQSWLRQSQDIEASKKEFQQGSVHQYWANDTALRPGDGLAHLQANTIFFTGRAWVVMGVRFHPWMSIVGYGPGVTLNNPEIWALGRSAEHFQRLMLWDDATIVIAPFPDTERRLPAAGDQEAFARDVWAHGENPEHYDLHYVRNYVMSVRRGGGRAAQPLRGFGYTRRGASRSKRNLSVSFSLI